MSKGHILVDLDGTLVQASEEHWRGVAHVGPPIPEMVERVKGWLAKGIDVRIFTARVSTGGTVEGGYDSVKARHAIRDWCHEHFGKVLPITNQKDFGTMAIYDDRAIQVEFNTGKLLGKGRFGDL